MDAIAISKIVMAELGLEINKLNLELERVLNSQTLEVNTKVEMTKHLLERIVLTEQKITKFTLMVNSALGENNTDKTQ